VAFIVSVLQALSVNKIALAAHLAVRKYPFSLSPMANQNSQFCVIMPDGIPMRLFDFIFLAALHIPFSNECYHFTNVAFNKQMKTGRDYPT
jgi:hypothetical protein